MSGLLHNGKDGMGTGAYGARMLHVSGFPFENTAAKFWSCLLDEVTEEYPAGTRISLMATCGGKLAADLLVPEMILQRDMRQLESEEAQGVIDDAMGVLELIGPPSGVRLRLMAPGDSAVVRDIVIEDIDAEIMPFLLAWILEWAKVPDGMWNRKTIRGTFMAEDRARRYVYTVSFELETRLLSEDLYQREVVIQFQRGRAPAPA
jgi:hypothetical protein